MKSDFFLNVDLLFSIQIWVMIMGVIYILYLVFNIWKNRKNE